MGYHRGQRTVTSVLAATLLLTAAVGCRPDPVKTADRYIDIKMYDKAEAILRAELDRHDDNATAHFALARCLLDSGKETDADREFDKAVMLDGGLARDVGKTYLDSARRLLGTGGDVERAVRYLKRVVAMSPDMGKDVAELCRAEAAKRTSVPGAADATILLFDTALELNPELGGRVAAAAFDGAGRVAEDDPETAVQYAEYAMSAEPEYAKRVAKLYRDITIASYESGDRVSARRYANRTVEINADYAADGAVRKVLVSKDMDNNEQLAVATLKRIVAAEREHAKTHDGRYATAEQLADSTVGTGLGELLATMETGGYTYQIVVSDIGANFYAMAAPKEYESTGVNSVFVDSSGVLRSGDLKGKMPSAVPGDETYGELLDEIGSI